MILATDKDVCIISDFQDAIQQRIAVLDISQENIPASTAVIVIFILSYPFL